MAPRLATGPVALQPDFGARRHAIAIRRDGRILKRMTVDIRKLVTAKPFTPFTIHTADGGEFRVPTVDHIAVPPAGGRIFVFGDDDHYAVLSPLLIAHLSVDRAEPA
jgi:hypothetical protein